MNLQDLVALKYGDTDGETKEAPVNEEKGLRIDLEKQTWDYMDFEKTPIGEMRPIDNLWTGGYRTGIIGVYDSTNPDHMKNMQAHKKIATTAINYDKSENW